MEIKMERHAKAYAKLLIGQGRSADHQQFLGWLALPPLSVRVVIPH